MDDRSRIVLTVGETTLTLHGDGRLAIGGKKSREDLFEALTFFDTPPGGREWWKFFLIHHIHKILGDEAADIAAKDTYKNPSRRANCRNERYVDWILEVGLHVKASLEAVSASKSTIWDPYTESPKTDRHAQIAMELLREGKSWADIESEIRRHD